MTILGWRARTCRVPGRELVLKAEFEEARPRQIKVQVAA